MMTGSAFLKRLLIRLDFMSEDERKTVTSYYEKRIQSAKSPEEEAEIVQEFGAPEHIAEMLRQNLMRAQAAPKPLTPEVVKDTKASTDPDANLPPEETPDNSETADDPAGQTRVFSEDPEEVISSQKEIITTEELREDSVFSDENAEQVTLFEDEEKIDSLFPEVREVFTPEDSETSEPAEDADPFIPAAEAAVPPAGKSELIFSRPVDTGNAEEIVHAMENPEIKPLYGEKVKIHEEDPGEVEGIDLSSPNDPTPEEVVEAKAQTLAKAQTYNTDSFGAFPKDATAVPDESNEPDAIPYASGEISEQARGTADHDPVDPGNSVLLEEETGEMRKEPRPGLFAKWLKNTSFDQSKKRVFIILFSVLFSPLIAAAFLSGIILIAVVYTVILSAAAALFLLMVLLIIGAVIELVYGALTFRESISAALIEIGIGLSISGVVCALSALIYEFLFGVVPRALKWFARLLKTYFKLIISFLYGEGGKA